MPLHASCESKIRNPMPPCVWPKETFHRNILHSAFYKKMIDEDHLKLSQNHSISIPNYHISNHRTLLKNHPKSSKLSQNHSIIITIIPNHSKSFQKHPIVIPNYTNIISQIMSNHPISSQTIIPYYPKTIPNYRKIIPNHYKLFQNHSKS